jgi:hypothetical protein
MRAITSSRPETFPIGSFQSTSGVNVETVATMNGSRCCPAAQRKRPLRLWHNGLRLPRPNRSTWPLRRRVRGNYKRPSLRCHATCGQYACQSSVRRLASRVQNWDFCSGPPRTRLLDMRRWKFSRTLYSYPLSTCGLCCYKGCND